MGALSLPSSFSDLSLLPLHPIASPNGTSANAHDSVAALFERMTDAFTGNSPPRIGRRDSMSQRTGSRTDLTALKDLEAGDTDEQKVKPRMNPLRPFTYCAFVMAIYFVAQLVFVNTMASSPEQAPATWRHYGTAHVVC